MNIIIGTLECCTSATWCAAIIDRFSRTIVIGTRYIVSVENVNFVVRFAIEKRAPPLDGATCCMVHRSATRPLAMNFGSPGNQDVVLHAIAGHHLASCGICAALAMV